MNKQQLASKIWSAANNMRSKIDANEYKDYILGFIFYKFLSDKEIETLKNEGWTDEDLKDLVDDGIKPEEVDGDSEKLKSLSKEQKENLEIIRHCQSKLGYFISYKNLFSTWLKNETNFNSGDVSDALLAFERLIYKTHKKVFSGILNTLSQGLNKLGESEGKRTKAIIDLLNLIKDIPTNEKEYDVLGFIYEYLISNFAANAGKKAGEFYTPHEASLIMAQIISHHLRNENKIEIYDPTSGSGSLLINIGNAVSKYTTDKNKIKYYAQELKENTFNLTRMNLVMHGVLPDNIIVRNGDTLADDWPYFEENDKEHTYTPLYVDAVVSNPPYSQKWKPIKSDARFDDYGIAPAGKADLAFLLHDLYHLKPKGIMTIVLPHGVLFRGDPEAEDGEGKIRKQLIEHNNIDAIIGLPPNIFFGTGIPTIIMVLKQKRDNDDILIIDASKGYIKDGNKNKLRVRDIKKIVDTYVNRLDIDKYSRKVSRKEIRENNNWNLNIPRYVDSSNQAETYDIYSSMFGGVPNYEIDIFQKYWSVFTKLKHDLFKPINKEYSVCKVKNLISFIKSHNDIVNFNNIYLKSFDGFNDELEKILLKDPRKVNIPTLVETISNNIFNRIKTIPLIDKYSIYQSIYPLIQIISIDLEIIQTEGIRAVNKVDPKMVTKKDHGKDVEKQDGWIGRILPFDLIWKNDLNNDFSLLQQKNELFLMNESNIETIFNEITEEEKEDYKDLFNNNLDGFSSSDVKKYVKQLNKSKLKKDTFDERIYNVSSLIQQNSCLKKEIKKLNNDLVLKTKKFIEELDIKRVISYLYKKWISPIYETILNEVKLLVECFIDNLEKLINKYKITLSDTEAEIRITEKALSSMIDELKADEYDQKGLKEFKKLLGDQDE